MGIPLVPPSCHSATLGQPSIQQAVKFADRRRISRSELYVDGHDKATEKDGRGCEQEPPPVSDSDLAQIYSSGVLSNDDLTSLQYKIVFELTLHFGRRGREGLKELQREDIVFKFDDNGVQYATLAYNPHEKNHQATTHHITEHEQKTFATNGDDCPVRSLKFY